MQQFSLTRSTLRGHAGALGVGIALALGAATTTAQANNDLAPRPELEDWFG